MSFFDLVQEKTLVVVSTTARKVKNISSIAAHKIKGISSIAAHKASDISSIAAHKASDISSIAAHKAKYISSIAAHKAKNILRDLNNPQTPFKDQTPFLIPVRFNRNEIDYRGVNDKGTTISLNFDATILFDYFSPLGKASRRLKKMSAESSAFLPKDTRAYVVINKWHEVIGCHSRFRDGNPRKSIYFFFLSKHDAIDHLYHVAYSTDLLKRGLGIASFSLKEYFQLVEKHKDELDLILVNNLADMSNYFRKTKAYSPKFKLTVAPNYHWIPTLMKSILVYRITSIPEEPIFSKIYFFTVEDAVKYWERFLVEHKKYRKKKLTIELSAKTSFELMDAAKAGLLF